MNLNQWAPSILVADDSDEFGLRHNFSGIGHFALGARKNGQCPGQGPGRRYDVHISF